MLSKMTTFGKLIHMKRREYEIDIIVNFRRISKVIIDAHYENKHKDSITDKLILRLVGLLNGGIFPAQGDDKLFEYYVTYYLKLD